MAWRATHPVGGEAEKVKFAIVRWTRGAGMELGVQGRKAFPHFIGVAMPGDDAVQPDLVHDCAKASEIANADGCDFIFSAHLLQRLTDYQSALLDWWGCLKEGGHLILYLPDANQQPIDGVPPGTPHHLVLADILDTMRTMPGFCTDYGRRGFEIVKAQTRDLATEYSFLLVVRKDSNAYTIPHPASRPPKTACVVRHGGFGDQLQAACLFPELKRQGYHLTVLTTPKGRDVIEHDPHVDEWLMVDKDQVPKHELIHFWRETAKNYDRFVNLNESVEGTLLAMPGRAQHAWPQVVRHNMLNRNYGEFAADLAQIPFRAEGKFYPSADEIRWTDTIVGELTAAINPDPGPMGVKLPKPYIIVYALSGSSPHKFTPWQDSVMQQVLNRLSRVVFVLVGDMACKILEAGWEEHPRVKCLSGQLSIRQTLALAQVADLVMGPETGVLNSVAYAEHVHKLVMLSHSSAENLTKHWVNTVAIPGVAPCYPCHQLHFTSEFCPQNEATGAAICQFNVSPISLYQAIEDDYTGWARVQMLRTAA